MNLRPSPLLGCMLAGTLLLTAQPVLRAAAPASAPVPMASLPPPPPLEQGSWSPLPYRQRSVSSSRQFIVYCNDVGLRVAVTGFVERAKETFLETLGAGDHWKVPIVINMERPATTDAPRPLSAVHFMATEEGPKLQIDLALRENQFREARFPQQVIRALLLEMAYRATPLTEGESFHEPPGWLVEGITERFHARTTAVEPNAAIFRQLLETGRVPRLADFLASNFAVMDSTSRAIYAECSFSLLEMLTSLPQGKRSLLAFVRNLGTSREESMTLLLRHFPALGGSEVALEKWWTLGLARFSATDRYAGLSVQETNLLLEPLLEIEVVTDPAKGTRQPFRLDQFKEYLRLQTSSPVLYARVNALAALQAKAHPLLRPVVAEYQSTVTQLARRRTKGAARTLKTLEQYRQIVVSQSDKIADYLNWYEATQMPERSGAFESYLKAARVMESAPAPKRYDALSRYIDQVQREFE